MKLHKYCTNQLINQSKPEDGAKVIRKCLICRAKLFVLFETHIFLIQIKKLP